MRVLAYLAWRNFSRNLGRYRVLLLALVLVAAVLVFVLGTVIGMSESLRAKASRYFAGNVAVQGFESEGHSLIEPQAVVLLQDAIADLPQEAAAFSKRSLYYDDDASLFFGGYYVRQRRLIGVEWSLERPVLEGFDLVAGEIPANDDGTGILISTAAARQLGVSVGDSLLVSGSTESGQSNTLSLIVRGIFAENSFFGYTAYLDRQALNRLKNVAPDTVNEMGVYVRSAASEGQVARLLHQALAREFDVLPMIQSRQQREELRASDWKGRRYAVLTLDAQLAEITDLLTALAMIAVGIVVMFLAVVVIGVANTYSMIVYERSREIGTLRAIGLERGQAVGLFLFESIYMGLFGLGSGSLLGLAILAGIRRFADFSGTNWAALFLQQGRLVWRLPPSWLLLVLAVSLSAVLLGSIRAAMAASRVVPVEALRLE